MFIACFLQRHTERFLTNATRPPVHRARNLYVHILIVAIFDWLSERVGDHSWIPVVVRPWPHQTRVLVLVSKPVFSPRRVAEMVFPDIPSWAEIRMSRRRTCFLCLVKVTDTTTKRRRHDNRGQTEPEKHLGKCVRINIVYFYREECERTINY